MDVFCVWFYCSDVVIVVLGFTNNYLCITVWISIKCGMNRFVIRCGQGARNKHFFLCLDNNFDIKNRSLGNCITSCHFTKKNLEINFSQFTVKDQNGLETGFYTTAKYLQ